MKKEIFIDLLKISDDTYHGCKSYKRYIDLVSFLQNNPDVTKKIVVFEGNNETKIYKEAFSDILDTQFEYKFIDTSGLNPKNINLLGKIREKTKIEIIAIVDNDESGRKIMKLLGEKNIKTYNISSIMNNGGIYTFESAYAYEGILPTWFPYFFSNKNPKVIKIFRKILNEMKIINTKENFLEHELSKKQIKIIFGKLITLINELENSGNNTYEIKSKLMNFYRKKKNKLIKENIKNKKNVNNTKEIFKIFFGNTTEKLSLKSMQVKYIDKNRLKKSKIFNGIKRIILGEDNE